MCVGGEIRRGGVASEELHAPEEEGGAGIKAEQACTPRRWYTWRVPSEGGARAV